MCEFMLETKNLKKHFGKETVVDKVNLKVRRGTIYGLLGANGAGKSTIMKMLTGMLKPDGGSIYIEEHLWSRNDLRNIGSLIEGAPLYKNLSARENLKVRTLSLGLPDSRIEEVLELVHLTNTGKKRTDKFSVGMKQRLGLAIAMLQNPSFLVLDEPTNGLDPAGIYDFRVMLEEFRQQGITILLSSHILSEVQAVADDIGIISGGKLCYQERLDTTQDLEALFFDISRQKGGE